MNTNEISCLKKLEISCDFQNDDDFDLYQEALDDLVVSDDDEVLKKMLLCFRDIEAGEMQYDLLEACEEYPDDRYVPIFIEVGQQIYLSSPIWFELAFQSILNTESCLKLAIIEIKNSNIDTQSFYLNIITELCKEYKKYCTILSEIKNK